MAIFGHMTTNSPPKDGSSPSSEDRPTTLAAEDSSSSDELANVTTSAMRELEMTMEELNKSIDESIMDNKLTAEPTKEEEPPHFTLATSPTRHQRGHHDSH